LASSATKIGSNLQKIQNFTLLKSKLVCFSLTLIAQSSSLCLVILRCSAEGPVAVAVAIDVVIAVVVAVSFSMAVIVTATTNAATAFVVVVTCSKMKKEIDN
jgi:hypothetical protein